MEKERWIDRTSFDLGMAVMTMLTGVPPYLVWSLWAQATSLSIALNQLYVIEEGK